MEGILGTHTHKQLEEDEAAQPRKQPQRKQNSLEAVVSSLWLGARLNQEAPWSTSPHQVWLVRWLGFGPHHVFIIL